MLGKARGYIRKIYNHERRIKRLADRMIHKWPLGLYNELFGIHQVFSNIEKIWVIRIN